MALVAQWADEAREQVAVRAMELQPVKASGGSALGGGHEVVLDAVHVGARHGVRYLAVAQVGLGRRRQQWPVAFSVASWQGLVHAGALPGAAGRALGAGVAQLQTDLGVGLLVHPVDPSVSSVSRKT